MAVMVGNLGLAVLLVDLAVLADTLEMVVKVLLTLVVAVALVVLLQQVLVVAAADLLILVV
jgi:hypothetical protein